MSSHSEVSTSKSRLLLQFPTATWTTCGGEPNSSAFIEIHVLREKHKVSRSPVLPDLRISCGQKIEIEEMFGFVTTYLQPKTETRRKIRIDETLHLLTEISRCAA